MEELTDYEFIESEATLADGEEWIPTREGKTDVWVGEAFICGGSCEVYWERDADGDGNYEVSILVDSLDAGASMGNELPVNEGGGARVRVVNTSGGQADFAVVGDII